MHSIGLYHSSTMEHCSMTMICWSAFNHLTTILTLDYINGTRMTLLASCKTSKIVMVVPVMISTILESPLLPLIVLLPKGGSVFWMILIVRLEELEAKYFYKRTANLLYFYLLLSIFTILTWHNFSSSTIFVIMNYSCYLDSILNYWHLLIYLTSSDLLFFLIFFLNFSVIYYNILSTSFHICLSYLT